MNYDYTEADKYLSGLQTPEEIANGLKDAALELSTLCGDTFDVILNMQRAVIDATRFLDTIKQKK